MCIHRRRRLKKILPTSVLSLLFIHISYFENSNDGSYLTRDKIKARYLSKTLFT